jgi:hypothetical protein
LKEQLKRKQAILVLKRLCPELVPWVNMVNMAFPMLSLLKIEAYKYSHRKSKREARMEETCEPKIPSVWKRRLKPMSDGEKPSRCSASPLKCLFQETMKLFCFLIWVLVSWVSLSLFFLGFSASSVLKKQHTLCSRSIFQCHSRVQFKK